MIPTYVTRVCRSDVARYFIASLAAFVLDLAVLSTCLRLLGLGIPLSASIGFVAGATLTYGLSTRWVFGHRAYRDAPGLELLLFLLIGLAGLGVTQLVLWVGAGWLGLVPELTKVAAAGFTLLFNYAVRRSLLFVDRSGAPVVRETLA